MKEHLNIEELETKAFKLSVMGLFEQADLIYQQIEEHLESERSRIARQREDNLFRLNFQSEN